MVFAEEELLPISALQHLLFCERQCALIQLENLWAENRLTAEGAVLHGRAHDAGSETRGAVRAVRALCVRSLEYGIAGIADVVEFHAPHGHKATELSTEDIYKQPGTLKSWRIFPVEYKRGKPKIEKCDEVQLCAQALCLEEMLNTTIESGALFYGEVQGRQSVQFNSALRSLTIESCKRLRRLIDSGVTPPAVTIPGCKRCSLIEICMPTATSHRGAAVSYLKRALDANVTGSGPIEDSVAE